ncbi:adenylate/guanylate cyclase domain-containing protein [Pseudomonas vranovensis]|uniref:Guanylate cyclase domain-containing protein n=1 Tax=Pseudomonas vranovensis TaxID=321661 RepID=A0A423DGM5_9PSED|nr:adenylate/guanylate cyclase domain-containing protein [Pseudomonas vranovensis]ROL70731.1 hypothetical protein BHU25_16870 [Pseudomonas vranovensis]
MEMLGRFDFIITPIGEPDTDGNIQIRLEPNPDRYKFATTEHGDGYIDTFMRMFIPMDLVLEAIKQFGDHQIHFLSPSTGDLASYGAKRMVAIEEELTTGVHHPPEEKSKPHAALPEDFKANTVFLSVDICNSTKLSVQNPEDYEKSLEIFFQELGALVGQHHGTIHKFTGDGFIAYIDYAAFTAQTDIAVRLGLALIDHLAKRVNPVLLRKLLPVFEIKVGMDFGEALVKRRVIPATGAFQVDFSSDALNRAVKIQESCSANELRIGQNLRRLIHTSLLVRTKAVRFDSDQFGIVDYQVYVVR